MRSRLGLLIAKSDIKPILQRERGLFRFDGDAPPVWFAEETPRARSRTRFSSPQGPALPRAVVALAPRPDIERVALDLREWSTPSPAGLSRLRIGMLQISGRSRRLRVGANDGPRFVEAATGTGKTRGRCWRCATCWSRGSDLSSSCRGRTAAAVDGGWGGRSRDRADRTAWWAVRDAFRSGLPGDGGGGARSVVG